MLRALWAVPCDVTVSAFSPFATITIRRPAKFHALHSSARHRHLVARKVSGRSRKNGGSEKGVRSPVALEKID